METDFFEAECAEGVVREAQTLARQADDQPIEPAEQPTILGGHRRSDRASQPMEIVREVVSIGEDPDGFAHVIGHSAV